MPKSTGAQPACHRLTLRSEGWKSNHHFTFYFSNVKQRDTGAAALSYMAQILPSRAKPIVGELQHGGAIVAA
jgi:hypothetical protein